MPADRAQLVASCRRGSAQACADLAEREGLTTVTGLVWACWRHQQPTIAGFDAATDGFRLWEAQREVRGLPEQSVA